MSEEYTDILSAISVANFFILKHREDVALSENTPPLSRPFLEYLVMFSHQLYEQMHSGKLVADEVLHNVHEPFFEQLRNALTPYGIGVVTNLLNDNNSPNKSVCDFLEGVWHSVKENLYDVEAVFWAIKSPNDSKTVEDFQLTVASIQGQYDQYQFSAQPERLRA